MISRSSPFTMGRLTNRELTAMMDSKLRTRLAAMSGLLVGFTVNALAQGPVPVPVPAPGGAAAPAPAPVSAPGFSSGMGVNAGIFVVLAGGCLYAICRGSRRV